MSHKFKSILVAVVTFFVGVLFVALFFLDRSAVINEDVKEAVSVESVEKIFAEQLENESYAVYSALLKDFQTSNHFNPSPKDFKFLVIGKETVDCGERPDLTEKMKELLSGSERYAVDKLKISDELLNDYHTAGRRCRELAERFDINCQYHLAPQNDLEAAFSENIADSWELFYKKYPESPGLFALSNVGFSRDLKQAFLYVENSCGPKCGAGYYVLLKKDADDWKVKSLINVWVS